MDKTIEIKRRAQRCILNGDLDGALGEYQKLVSAPDADPYHSVLLADLLYKKGDQEAAAERYFSAVDGYEAASLFKNAIAVCKKMSRLSLAAGRVLHKLAELHRVEGLSTEASLYFMQHAELMVRAERYDEAIDSLRRGFDTSTDNVKALERLAEVQMLADKGEDASKILEEAADRYNRQGQFADAVRCQDRAQRVGDSAESSSIPDVEHGSSLTPDTGLASEPVEAVETNDERGGPIDPNDQTAALDAPVEAVPLAEESPALANDDEPVRQGPPLAPTEIALGSSPAAPSLQFDAPGGESSGVGVPTAPRTVETVAGDSDLTRQYSGDGEQRDHAAAASAAGDAEPPTMSDISKLLDDAQGFYARGERESAGEVLVTAARAYGDLGHLESAASIYRGLHDANQAPTQVLVQWLQNCKTRGDHSEAAFVACEIGDRSMNAGDTDEAKEWFERAQTYDEGNEMAASRLQRLEAPAESSVATAEAAVEPETLGDQDTDASDATATIDAAETNGVVSSETDGMAEDEPEAESSGLAADAIAPAPEGDTADSASEHAGGDHGPDTELGNGEPPDLGWLIAQFQRGISEQLANDCRAHYDLGVSYREMGLLDEAIASFREAGRETALVPVATEMIVRCMLDQGRLENAVAELRTVLAEGSLETGASVSLYYQMGLALEAGGRQEEALDSFECVSAKAADYADVARKIRDLRAALGRS